MSKRAAPNPQVDLRGFSYALAPYLAQQEWTMDSLENQLALTRKRLSQGQEQCERKRASLRNQSAYLQSLLTVRLDPMTHRRGLTYLGTLQTQLHRLEREVDELSAEWERLQAAWKAQQRKLDGLSKHRASAVEDYASEMVRAQSAEADRDWVARLSLRKHGITVVDGGAT